MNKSRILIFGATGMLGHQLYKILSLNTKLVVYGTCRNTSKSKILSRYKKLITFRNLLELKKLRIFINKIKPDIVINCVGIIKQNSKLNSKKVIFKINSTFPNYLSKLAIESNFKFLHFSTDCVFSGNINQKKKYHENSIPDALDLYGKSKIAGEKFNQNTLILRTSFIGHELNINKKSFLDWFLFTKKKTVKGFKNAYFTGLTNLYIAKFINKNILFIKKNFGIFHLSGSKISKLNLLMMINRIYNVKKKIIPASGLKINRSLSNYRLKKVINFRNPEWQQMLKKLKKTSKEYF